MNEDHLQATFAQLRGEPAPPLRLTPDAMLAAGQRARRRRRAVTAGIVATAAAAAAAAPVLLGLTIHAGDTSTPVPPGAPPSVVSTVLPTQPATPAETSTRTQAPPRP